MDILNKKQIEFFNLADNFYIECINKYRNLLKYKSNIDEKAFSNEMRFICSQMGLACEYYLKGLIFPFLRINIPKEKEEYRGIIESLSDEEAYRILIGNDEVLRQLSNSKGIKLSELRFLQQYSIKSSGHNLLALIDKFSDKDYADIPSDLKKQLFETIKAYYFNYFDFTNTQVEATDEDIIKAIDESNISDVYVRGRYGHLDEYNLDYLKMIKLMHAIRSCCEKSNNAFSIVNGNGPYGTENATDITMIFPDENTKIYIIDENYNVVRVYKYMDYGEFLRELHDVAFEKVAKETDYFQYYSRDEYKKIQDVASSTEKSPYDSLTLVPVYGIKEMKRVTIDHDSVSKEFYSASMLLPLHRKLYIDKDKKQTIFVTSGNTIVSYTQNTDNRIRKDSPKVTKEKTKIIEEFDKKEHSMDEVVEEFIDLKDEIARQEETILYSLSYRIRTINSELEQERLLRDPLYIDYLRKTKQLKEERRKLLKEYKRISKNLKEGRTR